MSSPEILINGENHHTLSVLDRGLHYGDGVFETIAIHQGKILLLEPHLQRLSTGCQRLNIPLPDIALLTRELNNFVEHRESAVLKLIITRGEGGRGYALPADMSPNRLCLLYDWPEYPGEIFSQGARLTICETRLAEQPLLAGIKHLNRLEQVMARSEWNSGDIFEGITLDQHGHVIEATMSNLFLITDGQVKTPELQLCGIHGVMRRAVISACNHLDIPCMESQINIEDLNKVEACFLSNSIIGIVPIQQIGDQHFSIHPHIETISTYLLSQKAFARP